MSYATIVTCTNYDAHEFTEPDGNPEPKAWLASDDMIFGLGWRRIDSGLFCPMCVAAQLTKVLLQKAAISSEYTFGTLKSQ